MLREYAAVRASRSIADLTSDKDAIVELRETLADAAEHGITTLQVMSEKMTPARYIDLLKQVPTPLRIRIMRMPMTTSTGRDLNEGLSTPRNPSPLITVSGTKWLLDGVPIEGTFAPRQGLVSSPAGRIEPFFGHLQMSLPIKELDAMLGKPSGLAISCSFTLLVMRQQRPCSTRCRRQGERKYGLHGRVRFEHGDALFPDLIPRVKQLGIDSSRAGHTS